MLGLACVPVELLGTPGASRSPLPHKASELSQSVRANIMPAALFDMCDVCEQHNIGNGIRFHEDRPCRQWTQETVSSTAEDTHHVRSNLILCCKGVIDSIRNQQDTQRSALRERDANKHQCSTRCAQYRSSCNRPCVWRFQLGFMRIPVRKERV